MFNKQEKKRNKLKEKLLEEAKIDRYRLQLKTHIKTLEAQYKEAHQAALKAREGSDSDILKLAVQRSQDVRYHLTKLKELQMYIEKVETDSDLKDVYDQFLGQLTHYTEEIKENKQKNRKTKKLLKKHKKEVEHVSDYFKLIDKRIDKVTKGLNKNQVDSKHLSDKDVQAYFKETIDE